MTGVEPRQPLAVELAPDGGRDDQRREERKMKKVPTVSVIVLGPSTSGTAHSGTMSSPSALIQAISAFRAALRSPRSRPR